MKVTVEDIMISPVVHTFQHKSVGHVKEIMKKNRIKSVPVVDSDHEVVGIVTATDFLEDLSDNTPVSHVMTEKVYTIPQYSGVHIAARIMRNHKIHHLVVTHEKQLVGVLSSYDLLQLIEEHRFVMKNSPTKKHKHKERT